MIADSYDVIVIGAGPVGATAALLLASHGLKCAAVEMRREPRSHPAAHVLSTRAMEIWREIGLEPDIRSLSTAMHELRCIPYCTSLAGRELGRAPLADLPDATMNPIESISPTCNAHLSQSVLEPLLWLNLRDSPDIDLRTGWKYLSHTDFDDAVMVSIADTETGKEDVIVANHVIAADGSSSHVRKALGVAMKGPTLQHMVSVHFSADLERYLHHRRAPVIWTHTAKGVGVIIVHRPPQDLVFQMPYFPPFQSLDDFGASVCRDRILDAIGAADVDVEIKSIQSWPMHAQVASSYRVGRVFLAGDAAHRFPPTGGLSLNTGIADVHNLAWKLAWVRDRRAREALLDTYERERRPVGLAAAADSVTNLSRTFDVVAALGLPRRAVSLLPRTIAALPSWLPRRPMRAAISGLTTLAYGQLGRAASAGPAGRRLRRRAAEAIAGQGANYTSGGRDLGVRYQRGAVIDDGLPPRRDDADLYTPYARAGGRLSHSWLEGNGAQVSTLDLVCRAELTLLVSIDSYPAWSCAAEGVSISVVPVGEHVRSVFDTGDAGVDADALVVRPDGHIIAVLHSDRHGAASLRHALSVVGAPSTCHHPPQT